MNSGFIGCMALTSASSIRRRASSTHPCDTFCDEETSFADRAMCDTNGLLYKSGCEYNRAFCLAEQTGTEIAFPASVGACVDATTSCDVMQHVTCITATPKEGMEPPEQVCGSDNITYTSLCVLKERQCASKSSGLSLAYMGQCFVANRNLTQFDCSQYIHVFPTASGVAVEPDTNVMANIACPKNYHPICSLDDRTFPNECALCAYQAGTGKTSQAEPLISFYDGACNNFGHIIG